MVHTRLRTVYARSLRGAFGYPDVEPRCKVRLVQVGPPRCHLCSMYASVFGYPHGPLVLDTDRCSNCGGHQPVRSTVRRALCSSNPLLRGAVMSVEEPVELQDVAVEYSVSVE